jgi:D-3-phosphoglycerate dehydrogenase
MNQTVFVTAPGLAESGLQRLKEAGCRILFLTGSQDAAEIERVMADNDITAVISRTAPLSARAIAVCPALRVVSKHGVGVDNIDVEACTRRGIPVYVTPGANAQSVAELTIALLGAAARKVAWMDREIRAGRWPRVQDGVQLAGRTLGLVGYGQVGQRVARIARAIGMEVRVFDPALLVPGSPHAAASGIIVVRSLAELLPVSQVLSLHVPLTSQTRGLIDAAALNLLPPGAILINTARGEVVDEPALVEALRSGRLHAAGLDATADEPIRSDSPLLSLPTVILTPHVGGSTAAALADMARGAANNVIGFLAGEPPDPSACVNPQVLPSIVRSKENHERC